MYLKNLNIDTYTLKIILSYNNLSFDYFNTVAFKIFIYYNQSKDIITYFYISNEKELNFCQFSISETQIFDEKFNRAFENYKFSNINRDDAFRFLLIYYLKNKEKSESIETLIKRYFFLPKKTLEFYSQSQDKIDTLRNFKINLQKIIENDENDNKIIVEYPSLNKKLNLNLYLENDNFNNEDTIDKNNSQIDNLSLKDTLLCLKIGINKFVYIKDINQFLCDVNSYKNVSYSKELSNIIISIDSFNDPYKSLIDILNKVIITKYNLNIVSKKYITIDEYYLSKILLLFNNNYIFFNNLLYYVTFSEENINFEFEKDKLKFYPSLQDGEKINIVDNFILIINKKLKRINIYKANNKSQAMLFVLLLNSNISIKEIESIISKDQITKLYELMINKNNIKNINDFIINYYIDFDDDYNFIFKTIYKKGNEIIDYNKIMINPLFSATSSIFKKTLKNYNLIENGTIKDKSFIKTILTIDFTELNKLCNVYINEKIKQFQIKKTSRFTINVTKKDNDWFDINITNDEYNKEEIQQIINSYNQKKKYIIIKNNFIDFTNDNNLNSIIDFVENNNIENLHKNIQLVDILKINNSNVDNLNLNYDKDLQSILYEIKNFQNAKINLSEFYNSILKPYQISAIKWLFTLSKFKLQGILADDMGLGKTLETIAFISLLNEKKPILVICPKSLAYNWQFEFAKWKSDKKVFVIDGNKERRTLIINNINRDYNDVYIISYDTLKNDLDLLTNITFSLILADEAQYIKNSESLKFKAIKKLTSTLRFALTGTPIENSLLDLWSIFDFLMPNYLLSKNSFKQDYEKNFLEGDELTKKKLIAKITPFILRRTKKEVLKELPPKEVLITRIEMDKSQKELYDAYLYKAKMEFRSKNITNKNFQTLSLLTRLRQICIDPSSFLENYTSITNKLLYTVDLVKTSILNKHKILIFSQFTSVLEHVKQLLKDENILTYYINGNVKSKERLEISNKFNKNDDIKVTLISLKAGGTGLNLNGADIVIHLDPWWNFASEEQATDRAYRIGQNNPITVYKLINYNSIEEKIISLQEYKKDIYNQLIKEGNSKISELSDEDIDFILS